MIERIVLGLCLVFVLSGCGTKSPLISPQCSREERAENPEVAAAQEDAANAPSTAPSTPSTQSTSSSACGKLAKGRKNPSEPPNPITR